MVAVASASVPIYPPLTNPKDKKNGAINGPTTPSKEEMNPEIEPNGRKPRNGITLPFPHRVCRYATMNNKNTPNSRTSVVVGAVANMAAPMMAEGIAPKANHFTTGREVSFLLNQTRAKLPSNCDKVSMGIASRMPKAHTRVGNIIAAPPKPATPDTVEAMRAATDRTTGIINPANELYS